MTLPISLTCKTQEPSRTRTLRGTRGTSSGVGGGGGGGGGRPALAPHPPTPAAGPGLGGSGTISGGWGRRPASPQRHPPTLHPRGPRPVRPSWDHSGSSLLPGPARPRPEQASLSAHPPACCRCPHLPSLPGNPRFPAVGGRPGCQGRGAGPFSLIPATPTSLSPGVMVAPTPPDGRGVVGCSAAGRGVPGGERRGAGERPGDRTGSP